MSLSTQVIGAAGGIFTIVGGSAGSNPTAISITLYHVGSPGTYPLGVTGTVPGGIGTITAGTSGWTTPLSGAAGQVVITAVSATRIAGRFEFTAAPTVGTGPNRMVTGGEFDLAVNSGGNVAVPPHAGSKFGGTVGGLPWNAATVVMVAPPYSGTLTIGTSNTGHNINLIVSGYAGPGTYALGTAVARHVTVTALNPTRTWGGSNALSGGNLIITGATSSRIVGNYNINLQPGIVFPGTGTLALVGTFDVGIQP